MVRVVLPEIPEHSNANCLVLSELSLTLNWLSLVTIALDVIELIPVRVVIVFPSATAVPPIVIVLLAN